MVVISAIAGILTIVWIIIQIAQATGGKKTITTTIQGTVDGQGKFYPGPPPPIPLPFAPEEIERQTRLMPIKWVTYAGRTPPLKLKIRGTTLAMYRQASRKYINMIGQEAFERLPDDQRQAVVRTINAETYVLDWEGASYPNGNAMSFSPTNLALLLEQDPYLNVFLSDEVARISPDWDLTRDFDNPA